MGDAAYSKADGWVTLHGTLAVQPGEVVEVPEVVAYEIVDDPFPFGPPCPHEQWEPCSKHRDEHDECSLCGALRYKIWRQTV